MHILLLMEIINDNNNQKKNHVHVGILTSPGIGHIIPIISLAKRIIAALRGFHVTIFVPASDSSPAQSKLIESQNLTQESYLQIIQLSPPASGDDLSCQIQIDTGLEARLTIAVKESLPVLRSVITDMDERRPSVLIVDIFGTDAFGVADELGMLKYVFITTTAMCTALMIHLPTLDKQVEGEYIDLEEPIQIPGCKPIQIHNLLDSMQDRKDDEYKCLLHQASQYVMAEGILINTCEELEPVTVRALEENPMLKQLGTPPIYPVGPIVRSEDPLVAGNTYLDWLDKQPIGSVLFVSFGSGGTLSAEQITELAWGLERSQQRFLWVVREPTKKEAYGAYFNSGDGNGDPSYYLPSGFLARTHGVGLIVPSWCPQIEILKHESIGGCLTHCGWNTVQENIVHGVPMIAWPLYAEQKLNASMLVEDIGVAIRPAISPKTGLVEQVEIEKVVKLLMKGTEANALRLKAKEVKENVVRALEEGGSSYKSLLEVAKQWRNKSSPLA